MHTLSRGFLMCVCNRPHMHIRHAASIYEAENMTRPPLMSQALPCTLIKWDQLKHGDYPAGDLFTGVFSLAIKLCMRSCCCGDSTWERVG